VGEAGTIAATPAVTAAVLDAIQPVKALDWIDMPLTPLRVWEALHGDGPRATEQGQSVPEHGQQTGGSGPTSPGEGRPS
jgi:hypothetical protein